MPLDAAVPEVRRLKSDEKIAALGTPTHVWAVGALYGRYGALCALHEALSTRLRPEMRMVYLGNYLGAHSQFTGEGKALVGELMAFRDALTSTPGFAPTDVTFLRGRLEDLALGLDRLPFQPAPAQWAKSALETGLEAYLTAYGIPAADLLNMAEGGAVTCNRFAHQWRKQIAARKGHDVFFASLAHAAHTQTPKPVAFVPEGLDSALPLNMQFDSLRWPESDIAALASYRHYGRVIRGAGPKSADNKEFVLTLDGGNQLDGMIHAACLDPQGQIVKSLSF